MEKTNRRPFGFYVCSLSFTMERFAFYGAKWLIAVFVVASVVSGGLGLTPADGAKMTANLVAFTYLAPLIGGYISDRYIGARYLVPIGMILMGIGYLVGWQATSATMVNIMIILVSIGTGLFKTQTNAITGRLFKDPNALDSAFSIQYSFVNFGSFFGTTILGVLAATQGFAFCFLICGIVMFVNAAWFTYGWRFLGEAGKKPFKINEHGKIEEGKEHEEDKEPLTLIEKKRVGAIVLVSLFSVLFWLFWYLAYMPVYYYWGGENAAANWVVGNFQVPTSFFDSLNAFACIALGPILAKVWITLSKRPKGDLSMFQKTSLGLLLLGLSYIIFGMADITRGANLAPLAWIIAFGVVLSLGEMVFSPLGNSFITKFAPPRLLSTMMGIWVVSIFFAGKSYGWVYEFTLKFNFATVQFVIAGISIAAGIILWCLNGKLNSLVEEDDEEVVTK